MRQILIFFILTLGFSYLSCEKKSQDQIYPFEGEVLGINIDCHINEIKFLSDLDKVIELCGKSFIDSIYIAGNLPDSLKVEGLKIVLNIGKTSTNQFAACSMMGPTLNWVWITNAKPK